MNISQSAPCVPHDTFFPAAFLPLMRLIPVCIEAYEAPKTAILCRVTSHWLGEMSRKGRFDTPEAERRLAMLGITKGDIDRFAMWLLRRAGEMDCGEAPSC